MVPAALALVLFMMVGCAQLDTSWIAISQDARGQPISVLELPDVDCPQAVIKGERNGGCAWQGWILFGYGADTKARAHEFAHVGGLQHGRWVNGCAQIIHPGMTELKAGYRLCRDSSGDYHERTP
jgi:hypothetical protein